jgi:hypothetical protein
MNGFLDRKRGEIAARIAALAPLVEEYRLLQAASAALELVDEAAAADIEAHGPE